MLVVPGNVLEGIFLYLLLKCKIKVIRIVDWGHFLTSKLMVQWEIASIINAYAPQVEL